VTDWKQLSAVFAQAKQTYGKVDLVFANAGVAEDNSVFVDILDDEGVLAPPKMSVVEVNLKALITSEFLFHVLAKRTMKPFELIKPFSIIATKLALYYFKKNSPPGGGLVMTGSTSSYNERPNLPLYSAAKHGVTFFDHSFRCDSNIRTGRWLNESSSSPGTSIKRQCWLHCSWRDR
jgi:NAD(P)-dependent dehydrogenase (short-subunit alcohol dehydrogenase family)